MLSPAALKLSIDSMWLRQYLPFVLVSMRLRQYLYFCAIMLSPAALKLSIDSMRLCQYLHFCTSKSSSLSTKVRRGSAHAASQASVFVPLY